MATTNLSLPLHCLSPLNPCQITPPKNSDLNMVTVWHTNCYHIRAILLVQWCRKIVKIKLIWR